MATEKKYQQETGDKKIWDKNNFGQRKFGDIINLQLKRTMAEIIGRRNNWWQK
jgi:hypothetical protein